MELTFEDLIFVPSGSASSSRSTSPDSRQDAADSCIPSSYCEPSPLRQEREGRSSRRSQKEQPTLPCDSPYHISCPGSAHRKKRKSASSKFYVDPVTGVGKCSDPDCTWGYAGGDYVVTDLRGYAFNADGDPIMYLLPNTQAWKHVRLSSRR